MSKLPRNLRARTRARSGRTVVYYFYDAGGKPRREIALGTDYVMALRRWAELEGAGANRTPPDLTVRWLVDRYLASAEYAALAPRTQADYRIYREALMRFFDDPPAPVAAVRSVHVRQYLTWRAASPVRANREKALLSLVWNWARDKGLLDLENPCRGVRRNRETGRKVYVTDEQFRRAYAAADDVLRDVMDLAYLTGQRVADVLKMSRTDLREGALWVRQGKTDAPLRIDVVGELAAVVARITSRRYPVTPPRLVVDEQGRPITYNAIRLRWRHVTKRLGVDWQMRDLRAKAVTDTARSRGTVAAQELAGHAKATTTDRYIRKLVGARVKPTR
jgi:integrase